MMGKQIVRCPRDDRVTIASAMIHLLPLAPWIMAGVLYHASMILPAPKNS
jgi:hypothetical protein